MAVAKQGLGTNAAWYGALTVEEKVSGAYQPVEKLVNLPATDATGGYDPTELAKIIGERSTYVTAALAAASPPSSPPAGPPSPPPGPGTPSTGRSRASVSQLLN